MRRSRGLHAGPPRAGRWWSMACLTCVAVVAVVLVVTGPPGPPRNGDVARASASGSARESPTAARGPRPTPPVTQPGRDPGLRRTEGSPAPVRVLRRWDEDRAAAYAHGSVAELRSLYVPGAGASDVRVLASYVARGYRVEGMRMQLLAVRVLDRRPGEWRLEVTDRLASAVAVGPAGASWPLPRDNASTRVLRLVRQDGVWRVASVRG